MEETKKETTTKVSYEQLEQIAANLQQRVLMAESKLRSIDFAMARLTWLFKVLETKDMFNPEFVTKCVTEVQSILTIEEPTEEIPDEQVEEVN